MAEDNTAPLLTDAERIAALESDVKRLKRIAVQNLAALELTHDQMLNAREEQDLAIIAARRTIKRLDSELACLTTILAFGAFVVWLMSARLGILEDVVDELAAQARKAMS